MSAITMTNQVQGDDAALDESGQPLQKKKKFSLSTIFNKVADMAGRAAVTNTLKLAAVTTLAGLGASSFMTIGTAAAASALGSALYVYGKETALEWRKAKREQREMQWWDADRSRKVKFALLTGAAGGAFGAWLAGTDFFKAGIEIAKEYGAKAFEMIIPAAHAAEPASLALGAATVHAPAPSMENFNLRFGAVFDKPPVPSAFGTLDTNAFAHAGAAHAPSMDNFNMRWNAAFDKPPVTGPFGALDTQAFQPKLDIGHFDLSHLDALPVAAPAPSSSDIWAKVADVAARSNHGHNALATLAAKVHGGADSVSPQMLKDSAHDVLRLKDIPWQERLTLARQLAEEAQAHGNHQAGQFLKDLTRLEHGAKPHFNAVHHVVKAPAPHAEAVVAAQPDAVVTAEAPQVDLAQPEITGTAPLIPVEAQPLPPVIVPPPVAATFTEAAKCTVVTANGASSVACVISHADMHAGDYVSFVAAENPAIKSTTSLLAGSVDVPTQSFLHERIVADGVAKVNALRVAPKPGA